MRIEIEPTPELYDAPINGVKVPVRIWRGTTSGGVEIEAYVLSLVPVDKDDAARIATEVPGYMMPSREAYRIDL